MDYSTQIVYDYEVFGIVRFSYLKMEVTTWEMFNDFKGIKNVTNQRDNGAHTASLSLRSKLLHSIIGNIDLES
jgi:hypothetical protein